MVFNDSRADHTVFVTEAGTGIRFTYKGYYISLAMDGSDTVVFDVYDEPVVPYGAILGTGPESIRKAMDIIDVLERG